MTKDTPHRWIMLAPGLLTLGVLTLGLALAVAPSASARTQSNFDGAWSVLIVTDAGNCDRAYRYGVQIVRGQVLAQGNDGTEVSGRVDRSGRVSVRVGRGDQSAAGGGRLSGDHGAGTWRGASPATQCSGRWQAERH